MVQSSRTKNTAKNIMWGYAANILTMILHFVSRTIFIHTIGVSYLGINGLFTNVLGMLSLTELGVGTAIGFSLYKPVAEGDRERVRTLMQLYKKAYHLIAIIVAVIGLAIIPLLRFMVNAFEEIQNVYIYYIIFLFNTVSSYFVSYKYGIVNAEQKGYIINNLNSMFTIVITAIQSVALILFHNYLVYLLVQAGIQLLQKVAIGIYLNKRYPYLGGKDIQPLPKEETEKIKKNVFSLILHKIGEVSIYQTDNIIISTFISTIVVGYVSNYNLIITSISSFITIIFNSVTASFGNLVALENKEKQLDVFNAYNFLGFWLYGFVSVCYFVLFTPFITIWIGDSYLIDDFSLVLIIANQYLTGQRLTVNNVKAAGGVFSQDKYVSLIQGGINLVVSLVLVYFIGLPGVYIGTVVSGLFANIVRPRIVYRTMFEKSSRSYFLKFITYFSVTTLTAVVAKLIFAPLLENASWFMFFVWAVLCALFVNVIFAILFFKTKEFREILTRIKGMLKRKA